jgi:polyhydroxyalkanoate synthase subunit PhaC
MALGLLSVPHTSEFMNFAAADDMRRWYGRALDLWLARTETPSRLVLERSRVNLRDYGEEGNRPSLLIIPAPIKKAYIWDLTPSVSVVLACLQARFRVYVLEWTETPPDGSDHGLAVYVDELILECAKAIGEPAVLAGHSLGGTFATIFASLHPECVRSLILLETPLSFSGEDAGTIADCIRIAPPTEALRKVSTYPGTVLNALSLAASPKSFLWWRWRDLLLSASDAAALRVHLLVERWILDEYAMPSALFADVVDLYREDRFMRGTLRVEEQTAAPRNLTMPVLAVVDPESDVVPPSSVMPFLDALPHRNWTLLHYEADTGVALRHVGVLVGRNAHSILWPKILAWIRMSYTSASTHGDQRIGSVV